MGDKSVVLRPQQGLSRAMQIMGYLTLDEIQQMVQAISGERNAERNQLLILVLFQTGLRVSEALSLTLRRIGEYEGRPVLYVCTRTEHIRHI